jgi:hypothetical protein
MAYENLKEAVDGRSNDPAALYYYAKVLRLVGDEAERAKVADYLLKAITLDQRNEHVGAHLNVAVTQLESSDPAQKMQAGESLKTYVARYRCAAAAARTGLENDLPPNMDAVYGYLNVLGEPDWMPPFEASCGSVSKPGKRDQREQAPKATNGSPRK